ncbi:uncharacterized protein HMPREF1541_09331 [Cyphellophora europaea CBS 101466]|uniref:Mediator of RNA polymerase II transcription subunit 31 n=1 Tax=Cyphellophora europaea (strain CBS 101466) TaxID=1220924 RepID=W2SC56_CYPE1|nr:uncharacterized protein HMPREF1541_09331 [Cyphellophora europaea CBS 101466]ETN45499.1 hypothetical protein HMPREF1541_09331 [Cyphellophora europaea CBS 101466]
MELEFVLCLAVPGYLLHLAHIFPHLLVPPDVLPLNTKPEDSDAARFGRYLAYLYDYWRKPEYAQYLTHPGTVLRNLELLQQEQFKKDLVNPNLRHQVAYGLELVDPPPSQPANGKIMVEDADAQIDKAAPEDTAAVGTAA